MVQFPSASMPLEPFCMDCMQPLLSTFPHVPSTVVEEDAVSFAKPVNTTAQILHDGSSVVLPPGGSMNSVVASMSYCDEFAASINETSVVTSTVSVHPGSAVGAESIDTSVRTQSDTCLSYGTCVCLTCVYRRRPQRLWGKRTTTLTVPCHVESCCREHGLCDTAEFLWGYSVRRRNAEVPRPRTSRSLASRREHCLRD